MSVHENSIETFHAIKGEGKLPGARQQVYNVIAASQGVTRQYIAKVLGWEINRVTGRVKELIDSAEIYEQGVAMTSSKRPRARLWVTE